MAPTETIVAHTAGPWHVTVNTYNSAKEWVISSVANPFKSFLITRILVHTDVVAVMQARCDEADANARLIAVAPDLYAAAKALIAEIEYEGQGISEPGEDGYDRDDPLITMAYIRQLAAAIAKADGKHE